ncbi:MAG: hypothetical protein IJ882_02230 [Paludibacteraceae bacterium]|nr:hypothetical protein [Paludibacteraceae bacterium]
MIPDKIYILCCDNGDLGDASLYPEGERSKEYIRKEAILDWANGKMTIEGATEGIVGGYDLALKDLIKHIESL